MLLMVCLCVYACVGASLFCIIRCSFLLTGCQLWHQTSRCVDLLVSLSVHFCCCVSEVVSRFQGSEIVLLKGDLLLGWKVGGETRRAGDGDGVRCLRFVGESWDFVWLGMTHWQEGGFKVGRQACRTGKGVPQDRRLHHTQTRTVDRVGKF